MNQGEILKARKAAEAAVQDMPEGPLKLAAFQTILGKLLDPGPERGASSPVGVSRKKDVRAGSGTTGRLVGLIQEGFFQQQRSLSDIQRALAEHGWHYQQMDLSTPLTRLTRKRLLRRAQVSEGGKKLWKYSAY